MSLCISYITDIGHPSRLCALQGAKNVIGRCSYYMCGGQLQMFYSNAYGVTTLTHATLMHME